jgi:hypothetical protein
MEPIYGSGSILIIVMNPVSRMQSFAELQTANTSSAILFALLDTRFEVVLITAFMQPLPEAACNWLPASSSPA